MVCKPGQPCFPDLTGMVIKGRSVPGYDYITQPESLGSGPTRSGIVITNGANKYPSYGPRGAGLPQNLSNRLYDPNEPPEEFPLNIFLLGGLIGFIFGAFILTPSGRDIGARASKGKRR